MRSYDADHEYGSMDPKAKKRKDVFSQKKAYEDWVKHSGDDYPNLVILVCLIFAHTPNSVDPERNASNLKLTLTKQRNCMDYNTLNSKLQVTENGPEIHSLNCEEVLDEVAELVLSGGYTAEGFRETTLRFMKPC